MYASLKFDRRQRELSVECYEYPRSAKIQIQLLRHNRIIDTIWLKSDNKYSWKVDEANIAAGDYHVKASIEDADLSVETEWQYVPVLELVDSHVEPNDEVKASLEALADIPVPSAMSPHGVLAYVRWESAKGTDDHDSRLHDIAALAASVDSELFDVAWGPRLLRHDDVAECELDRTPAALTASMVISSSTPVGINAAEGAVGFGSGYVYQERNLKKGSSVVDALERNEHASSTCGSRLLSFCSGEFVACAVFPDGSVEFHSDYAGYGIWYEYHSNTLSIVASSFLLAVQIARLLGEDLNLNFDTIDADFTSLVQPFQQPLLDALEIQGFAIVRPDQVRLLDPKGGLGYSRSALGLDIDRPLSFTDARYNELLDAAAEEIKSNCAAILNDPDIREVRCDITGGLDSRVVLAGMLATADENLGKVSLFTARVDTNVSAEDERIASVISKECGVPFSRRGVTRVGPCSTTHLAQKQISSTYGSYWHRSHGHPLEPDPEVIYVGGAGLGNIARDYTTDAWGISQARVRSPAELTVALAQTVFKWRGHATMKPAPTRGVLDVASRWEDVPGSMSQKASHIFNFFRARLHGGGRINATMGSWSATPAITRSLYKLRLMVGTLMTGPRVQLELCNRLAPNLASIPYDKASYNRAFSALFGSMRDSMTTDGRELEESRTVSAASTRWIACDVCEQFSPSRDRKSSENELIDLALGAISEMSKDVQLSDILQVAERWARNELGVRYGVDHSYGRTFVNKVLHLYAMWRMCGGTIANNMD